MPKIFNFLQIKVEFNYLNLYIILVKIFQIESILILYNSIYII